MIFKCLDTATGIGYVLGSEYAYFYHQTFSTGYPEICERNKNLDWYQEKQALKVYRIPGDDYGLKWFDFTNWTRGIGGQWLHSYVDYGKFYLF